MSRRFITAKPLQAGKFAAIVGTFLFAIGGFLRLFPTEPLADQPPILDWQLAAIILVPLLSLGLVLVVTVETLVTATSIAQSDTHLTAHLTARPVYTVVRVGEASIAALGTIGLFLAASTLLTEPLPAPAGVGLMLLGLGVGLLILGASFVRTLVEYYYYRRDRPA